MIPRHSCTIGMLRSDSLASSLLAFGLIAASPAGSAEINFIDGFRPGEDFVTITGPINLGDAERFYQITQGSRQVTVFLESPGGAVADGLSIGAEIATRGFTTVVADSEGCHSICAVIWVSGYRRYMSVGANISVHAAYRLPEDATEPDRLSESGLANAQIGAFLNELGLSLAAIEYFTVARPDEPMLPITPTIAQALDIDVYIQEGDKIVPPSERPTPRRITRQVARLSGLAGNCSELLGVPSETWEMMIEPTLTRGHELFGSEVFADLVVEYVETTKVEMSREGTVRWCLSAEAGLRAEGVETGVTGPSFDCSLAETRTETTICGSPDLWSMDRAMANLYNLFQASTEKLKAAEFLASQRSWLKRRDSCASDEACLTERYSSRLFDFGF